MRINVEGWSSQGLRCPDIAIDLRGPDGLPSRISLVQMPNGTGKTTTLELLNATLNGTAEAWDEVKVRTYRRRNAATAAGRFVARLLVDGRRLTIELSLDFETGRAGYRTTNPGSGGIVPGWVPTPDVARFLKPQFLKLFVFDGEFAGRLFDPSQARADEAIDALCQIYLLDEVAEFARGEWERRAKLAGGAKGEGTLKRFKEERQQLLERKIAVEKAREKAVRLSTEASATVTNLGKSIAERLASVESTRARFTTAQDELRRAETDLARVSDQVMAAIRMPLALHAGFGASLLGLKTNLDTLRLPENTSAQFFEDLVKELECVCGREMTADAQAQIRSRSRRYLDVAEAGTINAMKSDIDRFAAAEGDPPDERLSTLLEELRRASRLSKQAEQSVRALQQKLVDEGDGQLKAWQNETAAAKKTVVECNDLLAKIDAEGDEGAGAEKLSLKALGKALADNDRRVAELTSTVALRRQTDLLERIVKRAAALARARIKEELVDACNAKLETVLANDPLRLDRIDRSLRLADQDGASVGQTLAVGYTFLMSVLNRGNNDFPLVVDSPANPMDEGLRRSVAALIPKLCSQFLAFTINTEQAGFVPALAAGGAEVRYLTLFRKTGRMLGLMADLPATGVTQSADAVLVDGRDYFRSFDVTDEEAY